MSDYGRYDDDVGSRSRSRGESRGGYSRNSGSMFDYGGSRDRDRDRFDEGDDRMGGWAGSGRTSAYGHERGRGRDRGGAANHERGRDEQYGRDDHREGLPVDETSRLIASNKVEGTAVYGGDGRRLGSIYNFMVDKYSGRVEYAVMAYGGMLGMGQRYYPLPWEILTYDTREGGYHIDMTERDLKHAPSFDRSTEPRFDRGYHDRVQGWYGLGR